MQGYLWFVGKRALQLLAVVFFGVSATFLVTHLSPISPVEAALGRMTARSNFNPEAIVAMREALTELYGVNEPILMPWTVGLLVVATLITFAIGNLLGGLAGYMQSNRFFKLFGIFAMGIQPIPYYIVAFILLVIFGFIWPVLPISGGFAMNVMPGWTWTFVGSVLLHAILPAASLVLVGFGGWFLGMRALVSNVVTEDYVTYAELAGVDRKTIVGSYVIRNALVPQLTALAMTLGGVFSGTVITEQVFNYPGLGSLLIDAVNAGDYSLVLAVSTVSVAAVAVAIFIVDLLYPVLDPRVRAE